MTRTVRILIDAPVNVELTNHKGENAAIIACKSPLAIQRSDGARRRREQRLEQKRQCRAMCALALPEAMAPIPEFEFRVRVSSLKFACVRHQLLMVVLATSHVVAYAPSLEKAGASTVNVQRIFVKFFAACSQVRSAASLRPAGPAGLLPSAECVEFQEVGRSPFVRLFWSSPTRAFFLRF